MNRLNRVTLTGADKYSDCNRLQSLSLAYPFTEFGILLSESRMGKDNRYPPLDWLVDLNNFKLSLAGHLCGSWCRDFIAGGSQFTNFIVDHRLTSIFTRIQLNISNMFATLDSGRLDQLLTVLNRPEWAHIQFIIQVKSYDVPKSWMDLPNISFLFDCSGGRGVLPDAWPKAIWRCGYAGGLTPDNLSEQLPLILAAAGTHQIWIDAESGLRTDEVFDIDKAARFLRIAQRFMV